MPRSSYQEHHSNIAAIVIRHCNYSQGAGSAIPALFLLALYATHPLEQTDSAVH
jgi:hypothetical protein